MKKIIGITFVFCLGLILWTCTQPKQDTIQTTQQNPPTIQKQELEIIEGTQPEPEFIPEEEMENQSPENAERD